MSYKTGRGNVAKKPAFSRHVFPMNDVSPDGDGGWSRHWLPKREGTRASGEDRRNPPSRPGVSQMTWKSEASTSPM